MKIEVYRRNVSIITGVIGNCYLIDFKNIIRFEVYKSSTIAIFILAIKSIKPFIHRYLLRRYSCGKVEKKDVAAS